ncbi:transporter [Bordetella pertussis]|nr:transporter [Bordetella pertussis]
MKVLISTDIEGVAGVFHAEQVRPGNGEYERARAWMTGEANAAIAGAIAGGAEEVAGQRLARRLSQSAARPARRAGPPRAIWA